MKTAIRKIDEAVIAGSADEARDALNAAIPVIAKTASKGTVHKKNASRKISRLTIRVNKMSAV